MVTIWQDIPAEQEDKAQHAFSNTGLIILHVSVEMFTLIIFAVAFAHSNN